MTIVLTRQLPLLEKMGNTVFAAWFTRVNTAFTIFAPDSLLVCTDFVASYLPRPNLMLKLIFRAFLWWNSIGSASSRFQFKRPVTSSLVFIQGRNFYIDFVIIFCRLQTVNCSHWKSKYFVAEKSRLANGAIGVSIRLCLCSWSV